MNTIETAFKAYSDVNLWLKVNFQEDLKLSDISALISQRIFYIIENWVTIRRPIVGRIESSSNASKMREQLQEFDSFVSFAVTQSKAAIQTISTKTYLSKYYYVFEQMSISDIPLSQLESEIVRSESDRVNKFSKNDFLYLRKQIADGRDAIADTISSTDETYNKVYQRSPLPSLQNKNIPDLIYCGIFQNTIDVIDSILANERQLNSTASIDPFAFARANANNPDIDISSYTSGTLVKLNYGETMQALATRTMGNPDKWIEIAIANGLKPPYIDEIGEKISLSSNGRLNQIVIPGTDQSGKPNKDKVVINQIVILQSDVERIPDQRVIVGIREVPISGDLVVQLSGDADLDKYKASENSKIRIFQKNTINSNYYVMIPSGTQSDVVLNKSDPWFLRSKGQDEKNAKVDLFLSADGDIQFSSSGDLRLSYGLENAVQAVKILLGTPLSTLTRHQNYGIVNIIGEKVSDIEVLKNKLSESISKQILSDARFSKLEYLTVEYLSNNSAGPAGYTVSVGVMLAGGNTVIPISFGISIPQ